jgi:predicted GNAT family N-acyltransferase
MIYSRWVVGAMPQEAEAIRQRVFVTEQGFTPEEVFDAQDERAWHLIVELDGAYVATGRLTLDGEGAWKLGKIAVLPEFRGQHIGDFVVRLLVDRALSMPKAPIYVIAQEQAAPFYERIGFVAEGETFFYSRRPHKKMVFPEGATLSGCCGKKS